MTAAEVSCDLEIRRKPNRSVKEVVGGPRMSLKDILMIGIYSSTKTYRATALHAGGQVFPGGCIIRLNKKAVCSTGTQCKTMCEPLALYAVPVTGYRHDTWPRVWKLVRALQSEYP